MVELGSPGYASNGVNEWRACAMTRVQVGYTTNVAVRPATQGQRDHTSSSVRVG